jgi:hypothetical protein
VHRFIRAEKANHRVSVLCRVLEVSRSGFYAFERRVPCQRARGNERPSWCTVRRTDSVGFKSRRPDPDL